MNILRPLPSNHTVPANAANTPAPNNAIGLPSFVNPPLSPSNIPPTPLPNALPTEPNILPNPSITDAIAVAPDFITLPTISKIPPTPFASPVPNPPMPFIMLPRPENLTALPTNFPNNEPPDPANTLVILPNILNITIAAAPVPTICNMPTPASAAAPRTVGLAGSLFFLLKKLDIGLVIAEINLDIPSEADENISPTSLIYGVKVSLIRVINGSK